MSEKSSFFDSIEDDRLYNSADFAEFFNSFITNGVFPNPSTNLQVLSNDDMTVTVKAGKAWINGYVYINDSDLILPIEVADGVLNRIDRIVVQFNTVGRAINAVVKKGTFASSPVAPALVRDADFYELGIADIYIVNGATSIVQGDITDLRMNTTYCGWVNSLIQADTTAIFDQYQAWFTTQSDDYNADMIANEAQFQSDFETWFATIQDALDGDTAGNLLDLINANSAEIGDLSLIAETDLVSAIQADRSSLADSSTQLATGTATAITLAITTLTDLFTKTFIVSADNGGVATTINGKPLYKPNTTTAPSLTSGKAVTVWYNLASNCFFIKASATGDALVGDVLAGKTFSSDVDTGLVGTMVDRGTVNITPSTVNQAITSGKHSGIGVVSGDADLISSNILSGKNIFGVVGTLVQGKRSSSGTVTPGSTRLTITGLTFKPSTVLVKVTNATFGFSFYDSITGMGFKGSTSSVATACNATMNNDGFSIDIMQAGTVTTWNAIE